VCAELAREGEDVFLDLKQAVDSLQAALDDQELEMMLTGEHDAGDAILTIHPGAGGTESQDWAEMLYRMYLRWAEGHGYRVETLDYQKGEEAGLKSVTLMVKGKNAFGFLRAESGVHRLVRISPFDSSGRRHTSFASVYAYPDLNDQIEVAVDEKERRRRPARERDRLRGPHHAPSQRHRGVLPERALAAPQPRHGDEDPAGPPVRARASQAG